MEGTGSGWWPGQRTGPDPGSRTRDVKTGPEPEVGGGAGGVNGSGPVPEATTDGVGAQWGGRLKRVY